MNCIIGTIMYCLAAMHIPGALPNAPSYLGNDAWRYAAYYQPAVLAGSTSPFERHAVPITLAYGPAYVSTYAHAYPAAYAPVLHGTTPVVRAY